MEGRRPDTEPKVSPLVIGAGLIVGALMVLEAAVNPGDKIVDKVVPAAIGSFAIGLGLLGLHSNRK